VTSILLSLATSTLVRTAVFGVRTESFHFHGDFRGIKIRSTCSCTHTRRLKLWFQKKKRTEVVQSITNAGIFKYADSPRILNISQPHVHATCRLQEVLDMGARRVVNWSSPTTSPSGASRAT
jgi:hypothetical protein